MKLRCVFKFEDQTVWCFLCSQTTVNELRFSAAACFVSSEGFEQLSLSLSTSLFLLSPSPGFTSKLLCQLLELGLGFARFNGSRPLISLQMLSSAVTVRMAHC